MKDKIIKIFEAILTEHNGYTDAEAKKYAPENEGCELWNKIEKALQPPPQQQEIDWEVVEKEFLSWRIKFVQEREDDPLPVDFFNWLKQRPEFSQPAGERGKRLAIEFADWLHKHYPNVVKPYPYDPKVTGIKRKWMPAMFDDKIEQKEKTTQELFELFLTQKQEA